MRKSRQGLCGLVLAIFVVGCSGAPVKEQRPYIMSMADEASSSGAAAYSEGDYAKAVARFRQSLRMNRSVDNRAGELVDLINIGRAAAELGDARSAVAMLEDALRLASSMNDEAALFEAHATLAKAHHMAGDGPAALEHIERSILIGGRLGRRSGAVVNLKGLIYLSSGRLTEAGPLLIEALKLSTEANDSVQAANSMRALSEFERRSGDLKEAYAYLERAYMADRSSASSDRIALDLEMMADISVAEGRYIDGAFLYERSYLVSLSGGQTVDALSRLEKLIRTYRDIGDEEKARFYTAIRDGILAGRDNTGR